MPVEARRGHGGHRGHAGGHAVRGHAAAGHVRGWDTLVSVLAVDVVTRLPRAARGQARLQVAHIIGMAAVTGEAITGIRPMDILGSAITVRAMAIHTTAMAIRTTGMAITVTTHTATDTGRP